MNSITNCIGAAALAASTLLAPMAYAQQPAGQMDMKAMMEQGHKQMMSMPMTGKPDVDFAMMMREHHKGALTMAEMELKDGKDRGMREMARKIISSQKKEIAEFDKWLASKGHKGETGSGAPKQSK